MATSTRFVIEGNLVTKIEIEEGTNFDGSAWQRETAHPSRHVEEWLAALQQAQGEQWFAPALQEGRILAQKVSGQKQVVIVELPPQIRKVKERVDNSSETRLRQLAFPWVFLIFRFSHGMMDNMYVFFSNQPVGSLDEELKLSNLPNIYSQSEGYKVCTGFCSGMSSAWSMAQKMNWLVDFFWSSVFNGDLTGYHWDPSKKLTGHPQSFKEWERMSKENPAFILEIDWRPLGKSIQQLLDEGVQ